MGNYQHSCAVFCLFFQEIEDLNPAQLKSRTIRIDALLFDEDVNPTPAADDKLADAMKSRTMRIDLPDEF